MSNRKQKRAYYWADPQKHRARSRRYERENRSKVLAKKAAWYAANPEVAAARRDAFRAANPNYFREYRQRRRLRDAWLKFSRTCAAGRRAMEATCPN